MQELGLLGLRWSFSLVKVFSSRVETTRQQALGKLFGSFLGLLITNLLALGLLQGMKLCSGPEIGNAMQRFKLTSVKLYLSNFFLSTFFLSTFFLSTFLLSTFSQNVFQASKVDSDSLWLVLNALEICLSC